MTRVDPGDVVVVQSGAEPIILVGSGALWSDGDDATYSHQHIEGSFVGTGYVYAPVPAQTAVTSATVSARVSSDSPPEAPSLVNAFIEQEDPSKYADAEHKIPVSGGTVLEVTWNMVPRGDDFTLADVFDVPCRIAVAVDERVATMQCVVVHEAWLTVNEAAVAGLRNVPRSSYLKFLDEAGTWRTAKLIGGSR